MAMMQAYVNVEEAFKTPTGTYVWKVINKQCLVDATGLPGFILLIQVRQMVEVNMYHNPMP